MQFPDPTPEQLAIIAHPLKHHARVLAVAGAGKTTTIVLRVAYLIKELGVDPRGIRVFAYNALARDELRTRIAALLPAKQDQPRIDTFHSFAYRWIKQAISEGVLTEPSAWWLDDDSDRSRLLMHRAIQSLIQEGVIEDGVVDVDAVSAAITLWKSALIPAGSDRAAHATSSDIPLVYARYEEMRQQADAIGFDDFMPIMLKLATDHPVYWRKVTAGLRVLIVDEYQDVNRVQHQLVELLAGNVADVMIVGDDDQTIYEWRGARPIYLLERFQESLAHRHAIDYPLTQSFRFGPVLAQCAHNVIVRNQVRFAKDLLAADWHQQTAIVVHDDTSERAGIIDDVLCDQLQAWIAAHPPASMVVLGRTLGQLQALEMACLLRGVPYRVLGRGPVYQRREHTLMMDYVHTCAHYDIPLDDDGAKRFLRIANTPVRGLQRDMLVQQLREAMAQGWTLRHMLEALRNRPETPHQQREQLTDLDHLAHQVRAMCANQASAYDVLALLVQQLRLEDHYVRAFGRGEAAAERITAMRHMIAVVEHLQLLARDFVSWLSAFDHTAGTSEPHEMVLFTTVYRAKGLEYEHVMIPALLEGFMPAQGSSPEVFDRADKANLPFGSDAIEEERRLFYVAITRAKQLLSLGKPNPPAGLGRDALPTVTPSRFLFEMKIDATAQIFEYAQLEADALAEALQEHGASQGMLTHLARYFQADAAMMRVIRAFNGALWPMRPLRPKR
jgi:DNA helicase-2/ATP-dependent DNA helicase PcrA